MKKIIQTFLILTVFASLAYSQASMNMSLIANKNDHGAGGTPTGFHYSSVWGYTAPNGKEYAIIGYWNGTAVYDISTNTVVQCDTIPGPTSFYNYREFTVLDHYLYIV